MSRNLSILFAAGGSAALLLGAFAFQYIGGLAPCELCLVQRWPHGAAVLIGILALATGWRLWLWPWAGALAAAATSAVGIYHAGVEWKFWPGPVSCSGSGNALSGLSGAELLSTSAPSGVVMCDKIAWQMMGISMAGWNALLSAVLVLIWLYAATRPQPARAPR